MRITFVQAASAQNGGQRIVAFYARALLDAGHDVHVITRQPQKLSLPRRLLNRARGQSRPDPNRTTFLDPIGDRHIQLPWKFPIEDADVPDADIIIATLWRTAFEVNALSAAKGRKVYFIQHHEVHKNLPWDLAAGSYYLPLKKIAVAGWLVDTMAERYGDHDVIKVENGIDINHFTAPPRARNQRPRVGLMYSRTPFKGTNVSLEAIARARASLPELDVLAFGHDRPGRDLPLPDGATFHRLPSQDALPGLYASCDAWMFGSHSEGFGLPLLEAMACRTPVVATRAGAAPDLIEDGKTGYLVPVGDSETMAARLVELVQKSPDAWRQMSDAAHARAQTSGWESAAQHFDAALQKIAAR